MRFLTLFIALLPMSAMAQELCRNYGPQSPRDISNDAGTNPISFPVATDTRQMNLCDIHSHTLAEHKGPDFSVLAADDGMVGYRCNQTDELSEAELTQPDGTVSYGGAKPGDTIEVHWVFTTCDVAPGPTLNSCFSDSCANPALRVESQVFLVVNDDKAADFAMFAYDGNIANGFHQPMALPSAGDAAVMYRGSTTGPDFTQKICSPMQVTWNVRPDCKKVSYSSLQDWAAKGNAFEEVQSHGVRQLVTAPELLSQID